MKVNTDHWINEQMKDTKDDSSKMTIYLTSIEKYIQWILVLAKIGLFTWNTI